MLYPTIMLPNIFNIAGKTAIVTGASYGLGATFAEALAVAGANVVLSARSRDKLQEVARRIADKGGNTLVAPCDVAQSAQVQTMVAGAWRHFGRVDILVNNAGIAADSGIVAEKIPDDLFEQTIQVNLTGVWYCCREVGARMLGDGKGGTIINIASMMGLSGQRDLSPSYQASKAAVINLTRNLACSWGDRGVRVNAIAPGWFASEMTGPLFAMPGFADWVDGLAALKRAGDPKELVGPLLFLASDASSFVTGHTLVVDGGYSAGIGSTTFPDGVYETLAAGMPNGLGKHIFPIKTT
jgi:NAD(P)-dependent dehydrogenase (short-subunit alcohol dehydrogenase family)